MTPDEYLPWEREQDEKHEYFAGEVFPQAGVSRSHSKIGINLAGALVGRLAEDPCEAHGSDMRVHIEATGYYAYPAVSVVCPPFEGKSDDVINNPVLIAEVLSPSTADFDRGGKFGHYRPIPSLREYLVIWQDEPRIEQHQRTDEGLWLLREIVGIDQALNLVSIDQTIPLSEIYAKIDFTG